MLALIVGQGALPRAVAEAQPTAPLVCALQGYLPDGLTPDITFRIETLGSLIADLRARGVTRICLCGRIRRPRIDVAALDDLTLPLVPRLRDALQAGDDGALRVVIALFQESGFEVVAAQEAAPSLLPPAGVPTAAEPAEETAADVVAGDAMLAQMGRADLGQACVILGGKVIAQEDDSGTDAMVAGLRTRPQSSASDPFNWVMDQAGDLLGDAADWLSGTDGRRRGVLFKAPKPGQDRRADLPTIGPGTVAAVARSQLAGIVIEAGGVIVLDQSQVLAAMDRAGLFLWVREARA
ncbi:LpxI family protein [Thalassococcus sp. BH17M4-6]|uniref:LpxI family protein n=1 Tax=Thalassococcus sp. BH17M4-6 TaxID=3413148 RepID=UPI003BE153F4